MATEEVLRAHGAGARAPRARQRARERPRASRVSLHRHARRRQDHHRAHPRQMPQLRDRCAGRAARLQRILEEEGVAFDAAGLKLVAQAADGSMRDALSLLDQLIAFGGGRAGEAEARAMLGTISRDHVLRIAQLLAEANGAALVSCARSLEEFAPDYAQVLDELAALLVRVGLRQAVSDYEGDELYAPELLERLARALSPEDVQLFYLTAIIGRRDLPLAPDPRTGFEMTLLRMIAFRPAGEWLTSWPGAADPAARAGGRYPPADASPGSAAGAAAAGGTRRPTAA